MRALIFLLLGGCLPDLGDRSAGSQEGECASCHPDHTEQFAAAKHSRPSDTEVFLALRARAEVELGAGAFCDRCHLPDEGISCLTCHAAAGNREIANGSLIEDRTGPMRGPWGDTTGPHASVEGGLLTDSALCGTCHEVQGLGGFEEHPYQAWESSPSAAAGERCQDCHMSSEPGSSQGRVVGPISSGGEERERSDHSFVGLQTDPLALLNRGVSLSVVGDGVALQNHAGHTLPDGAAFTRELWLESREDGEWTGDRRALHPQLRTLGSPTWDPVLADEVLLRGVPAGAVRFEAYDTERFEVCLRFRPVSEELSRGLGLPVSEAVTVVCAAPGL